jgi:hypothetical protein
MLGLLGICSTSVRYDMLRSIKQLATKSGLK